jgi:hypothetical protein
VYSHPARLPQGGGIAVEKIVISLIDQSMSAMAGCGVRVKAASLMAARGREFYLSIVPRMSPGSIPGLVHFTSPETTEHSADMKPS